jgi:hypothetical protein
MCQFCDEYEYEHEPFYSQVGPARLTGQYSRDGNLYEVEQCFLDEDDTLYSARYWIEVDAFEEFVDLEFSEADAVYCVGYVDYKTYMMTLNNQEK